MIGTPCYDGRLDVWYVNSLVNTVKLAKDRGIDLIPIWVSFDSLIQRARNDTIFAAIEGDFDDIIWIDSDIEWDPEWIFTLLNYTEDVVGGTYRKKNDREEYVIKQQTLTPPNPTTGLIEVNGLGTGFVKMSRAAFLYLWNTSTPYVDPKDGKERRLIFDIAVKNNLLMSEDIFAFEKLTSGGFKIWLDPKMCCSHIGPYKFVGNFQNFYNAMITPTNPAPLATPIRPYRQL